MRQGEESYMLYVKCASEKSNTGTLIVFMGLKLCVKTLVNLNLN